jgi:hypothetical protein
MFGMPRLRAKSNADATRTWDSEASDVGFFRFDRGRVVRNSWHGTGRRRDRSSVVPAVGVFEGELDFIARPRAQSEEAASVPISPGVSLIAPGGHSEEGVTVAPGTARLAKSHRHDAVLVAIAVDGPLDGYVLERRVWCRHLACGCGVLCKAYIRGKAQYGDNRGREHRSLRKGRPSELALEVTGFAHVSSLPFPWANV